MRIYKEPRDLGVWILPFLAYDTNKDKIRIWFGWIIWCFCIDFNEVQDAEK